MTPKSNKNKMFCCLPRLSIHSNELTAQGSDRVAKAEAIASHYRPAIAGIQQVNQASTLDTYLPHQTVHIDGGNSDQVAESAVEAGTVAMSLIGCLHREGPPGQLTSKGQHRERLRKHRHADEKQ